MKTKLLPNTTALAVALALWQGASAAGAEDAALKERTFSGTVAAVDADQKRVEVDGVLGGLTGRTFHLASDASITVGRAQPGALTDLKRGMEVKVTYKNADGIRVAKRVAQRVRDYTSYVKSVSPEARKLVVRKGTIEQEYWLPEGCPIVLHDKKAVLTDLKTGQLVRVEYVWNNGVATAQLVKDSSETLTGTVRAIDKSTGAIKVRHLLSEKQFNLADGCRIVVGDSMEGQLADLRLGQKVTVDFRNVDGVLVASRVATDAGETEPSVATTAR